MSDKCSFREPSHIITGNTASPIICDPKETKIIKDRKKKRESDKPIERNPERNVDYVF
jgi:hypothetical protein